MYLFCDVIDLFVTSKLWVKHLNDNRKPEGFTKKLRRKHPWKRQLILLQISSFDITNKKFYICGLSTWFVFCFRHQLCSHPITVTTRRFPHFLLWRHHQCATSSSVMKLLVLCGWWRLCEVSSSVFRQFLTILNHKEKWNKIT